MSSQVDPRSDLSSRRTIAGVVIQNSVHELQANQVLDLMRFLLFRKKPIYHPRNAFQGLIIHSGV